MYDANNLTNKVVLVQTLIQHFQAFFVHGMVMSVSYRYLDVFL